MQCTNKVFNKSTSSMRKLTSSFTKASVTLSSPRKEKLLKGAVAFVACDMWPISAIKGNGMMKFADALIEIGATCG